MDCGADGTFRRRTILAGAFAAMLPAPAFPAPARTLPARDELPPFAGDIRLPGQLYAIIARPPVLGWSLAGFDARAALRLPGVVDVAALAPWGAADLARLGGLAVLARDTWSALKGREALSLDWREAGATPGIPAEAPSSPTGGGGREADGGGVAPYPIAAIPTPPRCARSPSPTGQGIVRNLGPREPATMGEGTGMDGQGRAARFVVPQTAERLLETPCATARIDARTCEAWACLDDPDAVRGTLADVIGLPAASIVLHLTRLGGRPGQGCNPCGVVDAVLLSRAMGGAPVSLVWTREDDIPFRAGPGRLVG